MRIPLALAVATIATLCCLSARAATLYSSSATFNKPHTNSIDVVSNPSKPANGLNTGIAGMQYLNTGKLNAGVSSASVTVDVDGDTGTLTAMGIAPFNVTPSTVGRSISTNVKIVIADFPNPPVIQTISGVWQESITINGVSGAAPTFTAPATAAAMSPDPQFIPWYEFYQTGVLTGSGSVFLTGTYQTIGPLSTVTVPINIELQPELSSSFAATYVRGSNSFGNGFTFLPRLVGMNYVVVNPVIFDGDVDHLHFRVELGSGNQGVYFAQNVLPEPSCCVLLGMAGAALVGLRRGRR
jgi:archaellum component FlaG (FlaF/FlaG flagellin family)